MRVYYFKTLSFKYLTDADVTNIVETLAFNLIKTSANNASDAMFVIASKSLIYLQHNIAVLFLNL